MYGGEKKCSQSFGQEISRKEISQDLGVDGR